MSNIMDMAQELVTKSLEQQKVDRLAALIREKARAIESHTRHLIYIEEQMKKIEEATNFDDECCATAPCMPIR